MNDWKLEVTRLANTLRKTLAGCVVIALVLSLGCIKNRIDPDDPPDVLMKKGRKDMSQKRWEYAKDKFNAILEDHPDSDERTLALLYLSDAYFNNKEYEEAKFNYNKFTELYPAHERAARAHYYKAMSDFRQIDIATRDQTPTQNALEQFEFVIEEYPDSPYAKKSREKKQECTNILALNVMEISRFYFRNGSYQAAIRRLKDMLNDYPNQPFNDEALFLIGESYFLEQNYDKAKENYVQLLKQYPRTQYRKETLNRLRKFR